MRGREGSGGVSLGSRRDEGNLDIIPEHPHCVCRGDADAEAILHPLLHLPADEQCHLWGACQCMRPVDDGLLQGLYRPGRSRVDQDALIYVGVWEGCCQTNECLRHLPQPPSLL